MASLPSLDHLTGSITIRSVRYRSHRCLFKRKALAVSRKGLSQSSPFGSFRHRASVDYSTIEATMPAPTVRPPSR
ncbi:hypothetical protein MRS76_25690, partial [Rhizobiaceae bacterium n13]